MAGPCPLTEGSRQLPLQEATASSSVNSFWRAKAILALAPISISSSMCRRVAPGRTFQRLKFSKVGSLGRRIRPGRGQSLQSGCPVGRTPHLWLSAEQSLYDCFVFEWTLLIFFS